MKMKKIFAGLAMSTVAATLLAGNVFASVASISGDQKSTELSKTVGETFTWSVSSELVGDGTIDVEVTSENLLANREVNIAITGATNYDSGFLAVKSAGVSIPYSVSKSTTVLDLNEVFYHSSSDDEVSLDVVFNTFGAAAGTYSDTLTFTATIANHS